MLRSFFVIGLAIASLSASPALPANVPNIELTESGRQWSATYSLPTPATRLVFSQNIGGGRGTAQWSTAPNFEITSENGRDYLQRKDGRPFRTAQVHVPAIYTPVSGDYPTFLNFTDESLLVYTDKFLACASQCPPDPVWTLRIRTPVGALAIVDGQVRRGKISWEERRRGRYLFLGHIAPVENQNFVAVIDPGLPGPMRQSLAASFPRFMEFFSAHLGPLAQKPMLFASYDPNYPDTGTQGGAPRDRYQVFMHLYGPSIANDYGLWRTTWYFAHEASHLFQRTGQVSGAGRWIHEGAAEMFAALALRDISPEAAAYVRSRLMEGRSQCADGLKRTSLQDAAQQHQLNLSYDLYYECGLVLQERFDHEVRARHPESDGLFALWRDYQSRVDNGALPGRDTYLAAVEALAGAETASWARRVIGDRLTDPAAVLR
jgi:hypothetical protein